MKIIQTMLCLVFSCKYKTYHRSEFDASNICQESWDRDTAVFHHLLTKLDSLPVGPFTHTVFSQSCEPRLILACERLSLL